MADATPLPRPSVAYRVLTRHTPEGDVPRLHPRDAHERARHRAALDVDLSRTPPARADAYESEAREAEDDRQLARMLAIAAVVGAIAWGALLVLVLCHALVTTWLNLPATLDAARLGVGR